MSIWGLKENDPFLALFQIFGERRRRRRRTLAAALPRAEGLSRLHAAEGPWWVEGSCGTGGRTNTRAGDPLDDLAAEARGKTLDLRTVPPTWLDPLRAGVPLGLPAASFFPRHPDRHQLADVDGGCVQGDAAGF